MKYQHKFGQELEKILAKAAKSPALLHEFLYDLLSPAEYMDLAIRWQIVLQLHNKVSHRDISQSLNVSVATVTRGSRELLNKNGGFKQALDKYYKKNPAK